MGSAMNAASPSRRGGADHFFHVAGAADVARRVGGSQGAAVTIGAQGVGETRGGYSSQAPSGLAGGGHGEGGASVIAVAQRHHLVCSGIAAGGENGGFVGFGAAVGEETLSE